METVFRTWKQRVWRWRRWIILLTIIVLVRASLPAVLRRVLVSQASQLLKARVELGDLDLHLLRGGVVLKDFAIHATNGNGAATGGGNGGTPPAPSPAAGEPPAEGAATATRPIIAWKSLAIDVHWLPLVRRTVQFGAIVLESPRIALDRLESGQLNVEDLLRAATEPSAEGRNTPGAPSTAQTPAAADAMSGAESAPPASSRATPTPTAAANPTPRAEEAAAPSGWRIGIHRLELGNGSIRFRDMRLKGSEPVDIAIPAIQVADIALSPDVYGKPTDFHLRAAVDQGSLELAARVQLSGNNVSLDCDLKAQGLPLRRTRLYIPQVRWSDLRIAARSVDVSRTDVAAAAVLGGGSDASGIGTRADAGNVRMKGDLSFVEPRLALADGKDFLVTVGALGLGIADLSVPGAVAAKPAGPAQPTRVALRDLKVDAPSIRPTRTKDGLVLPGPSKPAAGAPEKPAAAAPPASDARAGVDVSLGAIRIDKGRVALTDRTLTPTFSAAFTDIKLAGRDIRVPELAAKQVLFGVTTPEEGEIELSGDVAPSEGALRLEAHDVALTPYSPYAAAFSPYRIASGSLQLSTQVKSDGKRHDVSNRITLQDFDVEGSKGESLFEQQFGIPLTMGLALLRDAQGNINLNVPVQIGEEGTKIDVWAVVGGALRSALVGALTAPLRLVGSVVGGGDKVGAFAPAPITFRSGRAELTAESAKSLERMAGFLASRPGMGVELQAVVTQADQRWLHEQALLQHWQEQGFFGRVRALAQRGTRDRVQSALEARAKDQSAELSAEDAQALDQWLAAIPAPSPQQLQALAAARLAKAAATLREAKGMDGSRLALVEPTADLAEGAPEVKIQLKPVKKLHAAAGSAPVDLRAPRR